MATHMIPFFMRAVIDTNILVSAIRSQKGASFQLLRQLQANTFQPVISVPLVLEYEDVLNRFAPEFGLNQIDVKTLLDYIASKATHQEIHYLWRPFLRDPKDNMVLEVAFNSQAKYIITYNLRDFRGSRELGITAIEPNDFLVLLGGLA